MPFKATYVSVWNRSLQPGVTAPASSVLMIRLELIRAQIEPGLPSPGSNRSPYLAPFYNKPKSAVFSQTGKIYRSYKRVLRPDLMLNWLLMDPEKRSPNNAFMGQLKALYGAQFWRILANGAIYWP
jgi:hypothetical protein